MVVSHWSVCFPTCSQQIGNRIYLTLKWSWKFNIGSCLRAYERILLQKGRIVHIRRRNKLCGVRAICCVFLLKTLDDLHLEVLDLVLRSLYILAPGLRLILSRGPGEAVLLTRHGNCHLGTERCEWGNRWRILTDFIVRSRGDVLYARGSLGVLLVHLLNELSHQLVINSSSSRSLLGRRLKWLINHHSNFWQ